MNDDVVHSSRGCPQVQAEGLLSSKPGKEVPAEHEKELAVSSLELERPMLSERPGRAHGSIHKSSGACVLAPTAVSKLLRTLEFPPAAAAIYVQIRLSKATAGYKVVVGTSEQLQAYAHCEGLDQSVFAGDQGMTHGLTVFAGKTICLMSPSKEALIHELIHAATFETILAVKLNQKKAPEILAAIERLEALKDRFLDLDVPDVDRLTGIAYRDAVATIAGWQNDQTQPVELRDASALAEFMAWGLANRRLAEIQRGVPAKLVQPTKEALAATKALFFQKSNLPKQADDMLSQLHFNTTILIRAQASLKELAGRT